MSRPDSLLGDVGRRVREEDDLDDPRWDALAAGELADEEAALLRARAEDGQAHPLAYEAFRAIDEEERDAMADALFARMERGPATPSGSPKRSGRRSRRFRRSRRSGGRGGCWCGSSPRSCRSLLRRRWR